MYFIPRFRVESVGEKMNHEEDETQSEVPAGPMVFVKAGLVALLQILLILFLAWLWWKAHESRPVWQLEKFLQQQK